MCRTPDPIGGNAVRVRIRRLAMVPSRTDAIYLALDPDLGPDPSTGLESSHSTVFLCAKNIKIGRVPCGTECGPGF
jgi:hypothetical protein